MRRMTLFVIAIAALGLAVAGATSTQADSRCHDCTVHHSHRTPIPVQMISMRRAQPPVPQFEAPLPEAPAQPAPAEVFTPPPAQAVPATPPMAQPAPAQPVPPIDHYIPEAPPVAQPMAPAAPVAPATQAPAACGCKPAAPCGKVGCADEGCAAEGCASQGCAAEGCSTAGVGKACKAIGGIGSLLKGIKCPIGTGGLGIARCTDGGCSEEPGCASEAKAGCASEASAGCADEGCGIARCSDGKCIGGLIGSLLGEGKGCSCGQDGCNGGSGSNGCGCGPNGNGCCANGGNGCGPGGCNVGGPVGALCSLCNGLGGSALGLCPGCGGLGCHGGGVFPDAGWAMPAAAPILRSPIQYSRYLPTQAYGTPGAVPAASYPMVYRPMDTTQLGFGYHNVPYWQPNPAMLPQMPHPASMHSRVCPNGMMGNTLNCNTGNCYGQTAPATPAAGMAATLKPVPEPQSVAQQPKKKVPAKQVSRKKPLNAKAVSFRR